MKAVRTRLMQRDLSVAAYCRQNGYTRQNLAAALLGKWTAAKAEELVRAVLKELEITQ